DSTDPPSESSTISAPRRSLLPANASKSAAVVSVTGPVAEIQTRAGWPPQEATSVFHSNRIDASLVWSFAADAALANKITQAATRAAHLARYDFTPIPSPIGPRSQFHYVEPRLRADLAKQGTPICTDMVNRIGDSGPELLIGCSQDKIPEFILIRA